MSVRYLRERMEQVRQRYRINFGRPKAGFLNCQSRKRAASERLLENARAKKMVFVTETEVTREMLENLVKVIWVDGENQVEVVLKE